jgi:phage-related protein
MGRNLGKPLFDRSKKQLEGFLNTLNQLQADGSIDRFVGKVHKVGAVVGNEMAYAGKVVHEAFRGMWGIASPIINGIRNNWARWQPVIQTLGYSMAAFAIGLGGVKTALMAASMAMKLLNVAMLTNPVGWIILGVGLLIGLFIKMNGGIEGSKKKLLEIWGVAQKFGQAIADIFTKADPTRLMDMGFSRNFNAAVWKVVTGARFMVDQIVQGWAWVQQQAVKYWPIIQATAIKVFNALAAAFAWVQQQAATYWPSIQSVIMTVINDLVSGFNWLQAAAIKYWPLILATILGVWNKVQTTVLPTIKTLLTVAVTAFKQIGAVALPLGAAIYNFFKAIAPTVLTLVGVIAWAVMNILWPVALQIWKVLLGVAAAVIPVVVNIATSIVSAFTAVLNWFSVIWPAIQKIVMVAFAVIMLLWAYLGPYIMAVLSTLGSIITGGFQVIMAVVQFVWTTICSVIQIAWAIISGLIQTALGLLTGDWEMAWNGIKTIFEGIWNGIINFLGGLGSLFYDSGKAIITTLVDGIKSMAMAPVNAIKGVLEKVREFLPFSDAKKGPLSALTYSGGAVMTTLATGVNKQQGALQDALNNAFAGTNLGMNISATATSAQMAPSASFSAAGTNIAPTQVSAVAASPAKAGGDINVASLVGKIDIHAQPGDNADDLVDQFIDRLHTRAKEAAAILTSADKAALV